ncbi:MAG: hypothetical protein M3Z37_09030 [Candidatus Eremiobacteraeota bacterium]|nr:hypothetical protein [Candidatus Eremiobacteraeota bacterium]
MKRLLHAAILWRLTALALIAAVLGAAAAPWPALGAGGPSIAVIQFSNDAAAPQSAVDALSQSLYQAVASSSQFSAAGSGPLKVTPAIDGDPMIASLRAGARAHAQEVVMGDIIHADSGSIVYRLTAYRVEPVAFIRSQLFTLNNARGSAMVSALASNLATLHAPRTAVGMIFSVTNGVFADLGESGGFKVGQQFNVMRNGTKVAVARITQINLTQATLALSNQAQGYTPAVGDRLIGIESLPAIAPATRANPNTFSLWGLVAVAGLTLLAIGHHGQPGDVIPQPSPSTSPSGAFIVTSVSQTGAAPGPVSFIFTFSQPVDQSSINFTNTNAVNYTTTNPTTPTSPVTNLGGAPPSFDSTFTQLTINANNLTAGEQIMFNFTSAITSGGQALTPFTHTFQLDIAHHPFARPVAPVPAAGGVLGQPPPPHAPAPKAPHDPQGPHGPHVPK